MEQAMRLILPGLLTLTALVGCATTETVMIEPKDKVAVIAHRGASAYTPENTLAAFELAHEMEADWYELDCLLTKDDVVIVSHDSDLERCTNGTGPVAAKTLAELKTLDAGSWYNAKFAGEPMPTLVESLAMAKDRIGVYVEIKSIANDGALMKKLWQAAGNRTTLDDTLKSEMIRLAEASGNRNVTLARGAIEDIRAADMPGQAIIQSFSPIICLMALLEAPEIRTEYLGSYDAEKPKRWDAFVQWGMLIDVAGFNVSHKSINPERLALFQDAGKTVALWTVDDKGDMRRYIDMGVDAIITNRPDDLRAVLAAP
jgi:glycerophosphoryl diester phosphodiesterase